MRAILHCHSNFSYDSVINTDQIIDFCLGYKVKFLILSDHNTVKGSLDVAKKIKSKGLSIVCPPAAEYKTQFGDIILVGLPYDLENPKFEDLVRISQNDNCRLLFPHPYHDHTKIEYLANKVDFIEVFNYLKSKIINHMFLSSISSNYNLILRPKKLRLLKELSEQISNINYFYFTFLCGHEGIK